MNSNIRHFNLSLKTVAIILVLAIFATLIPAGGLNVSYAEEPYSSFLDPDVFDLSDYPDTSEAGEILQSGRVSEYERLALEKLGKPATVENINPYRRSDVSYQRTELANAFSRDYNETSGNVGLRKVVRTFVKEADELIHVTIKGKETVCTNEHPFYSPVKGWTAACKLRAGDILVTVNGEYVVVEKIQHEILESPVKVYNFEVEGYHTYYVGDEGVLVHNDCTNLGARHGASGSYEIQFQSGKNYVGKGSITRMHFSARIHSKLHNDPVVSMVWEYAPDSTTAFVDEYFKMAVRGVNNANTYNVIWSPGRRIFIDFLSDLIG